MTISARSMAHFADFRRGRAVRWIFAAAVLGAAAISGAADAQARMIRAGAYDGTWNVTFATQAGNCSSTNSVPFSVAGTRVSSAGGGKVTGGISPRRQRFGQDIRRCIGCDRQWPAGRQLGRRPLERDYYRRQVQRQLAGHAELISELMSMSRVPTHAGTIRLFADEHACRDLLRKLTSAAYGSTLSRGRRVRNGRISAVPEPSRPDGLRNARPARPWQTPRRRS